MNQTAPFPHRFHSDPERSYALTAPYYTDPKIFEMEREAIFFKKLDFRLSWGEIKAAGLLLYLCNPGSGNFHYQNKRQ